MQNSAKYISGEDFTPFLAERYSLTSKLPYRYLAYRDFPNIISNYKNINRVLDFGCGTGASTQYLLEKNYDVVIGTDKSSNMLKEARSSFPKINFVHVSELQKEDSFDLVFSSFVLFELSSKNEIINYLNQAASFLKPDGIFYGITGSENLHKKNNLWACFDTNYFENTNPKSGDVVKLKLKETDIEFEDYFWTESDYIDCINKSNFHIEKVYTPLGQQTDPFDWVDEKIRPPFIIFLLRKF
jgi:trans-aconitate methyltransferase